MRSRRLSPLLWGLATPLPVIVCTGKGGSATAIAALRQPGGEVVIVTGDNARTAAAIAE